MNAFAHLKVAALSDVGKKRKNNEDAFGTFPASGVFCVADGMGGGDDGEIASAAVVGAVEEVAAAFKPTEAGGYSSKDIGAALARGLTKASSWICNRAHERKLNGCGSTFVGVVFDATDPGQALAVHAGDSRLYLLRGRSIRQVTRDHSVAELMGEKDESKVNPMFRSMVVNGIGLRPKAEPEFTPFKVEPGDRVLACSDGLSRMVPDKRILAESRAQQDPAKAVKALIGAALDGGGVDNVTVVLVEVGSPPPPLARLEAPASSVSDEDAETADERATEDETADCTGKTQTHGTMLTGIAEERAFGEESSADVAAQAPEQGHRRRIVIWIVAAVLLVGVAATAIFFARKDATGRDPASEPAMAKTHAAETKAVEAKASEPTVAEHGQADVPGSSPPKTPAQSEVGKAVVAQKVSKRPESAPPPPDTNSTTAVSRLDPAIVAFAAVCEEKSAKAFVHALRRLVRKDGMQGAFDEEADRFLKSARQLSRKCSVRNAEAAAVDLRVLMLNAEPVRTALASRRGESDVAAALTAWNEVQSSDPSKPASPAACERLMKAILASLAK